MNFISIIIVFLVLGEFVTMFLEILHPEWFFDKKK